MKQARSYLKSIFDEAIEQEFLVKDPTRKLKIPKNLRPKDKQILTWDQLRAVLAQGVTSGPAVADAGYDGCPSAQRVVRASLAYRSTTQYVVANRNRLPREDSSLRKDPKESRQGASSGWTRRELMSSGTLECQQDRPKDSSPDAFMFPNATADSWIAANYRYRVLKPLADTLEIPKLNFQVLRRTIATRAQNLGSVKDIQSHLRHSRADTTANEYMQELPESVQQMVGTVYAMLTSTARAAADR